MDGFVWEMKAPSSSNLGKLQRVFRWGMQPRNVILDSMWLERLSDSSVENEMRRARPPVMSI